MVHDPALFTARQQEITDSLKKNSLVAVFQASTQGGKFSLREDGINKVDAMYAGGVRTFEFLLRGDKTIPLDTHSELGRKKGVDDASQTYVGQVLATISELKAKYPDAVFGVGTISSPEVMQKVVANKDISFVMTAHWPGAEKDGIIDLAVQNNLPILPTASMLTTVPKSMHGDTGETIDFSSKDVGKDTLVPADMAKLRSMGVNLVKASDFTEIALKRAAQQDEAEQAAGKPARNWKENAKTDALTKVSFGLIAVAEALLDSFDGPIPDGQKFTVATTGGVDDKSLPYIGGSTKNSSVNLKILEILGAARAGAVKEVLDHTTLGSGGTFMTKKHYDDVIANGGSVEDAQKALTAIAQKGTQIALAAVNGDTVQGWAKTGA